MVASLPPKHRIFDNDPNSSPLWGGNCPVDLVLAHYFPSLKSSMGRLEVAMNFSDISLAWQLLRGFGADEINIFPHP